MPTYLFVGAGSKIAQTTADLLPNARIIAISTKTEVEGNYSELHTVTAYNSTELPTIDEPLDGLVYFPGSINLKPFKSYKEADFLHDFNINALGAAVVVQKYLNQLKKSPSASVVFISTVAVGRGMPFHASIAMAKGALEALGRALAAELAPVVRVNVVAPSLTDTPLAAKLLSSPEKIEATAQRHPLKKVGQPQDVAAAIAFLLQDSATFITGQVLHVDGGMSTI